MLALVARPDVQPSPTEATVRRALRQAPTVRTQPPNVAPTEPPASVLESRPPRLLQHLTYHDQTGGQAADNNGSRVAVGRSRPWPTGEQEASLQPQRPTFRPPATAYASDAVPLGV